MLDLRDGGFLAMPGLLAGLALGVWLAWRDARLRRPLWLGLLVGVLCWSGGHLILQALERSSRLPEQALVDLRGHPVQLGDYRGRPLVINLWATWCPPCRREMPVLAEAQQRESGVTFLFVNQGEGARTVSDYLTEHGLWLENVLLDSGSRLGPGGLRHAAHHAVLRRRRAAARQPSGRAVERQPGSRAETHRRRAAARSRTPMNSTIPNA